MQRSNTLMKQTLQSIAKSEALLREKGGPENDGELFEGIIGLQKAVLNSFSLPLNKYYFSLVSFDEIPDETEVKQRLEQLHKEAVEYLASSAKTDIQILQNAQDTNSDPFLVLPELKIPTHVYTIFLIEKMLIEKKEKPEAILEALKVVTAEEDILDALGRYADETNTNEKWKLFAYAMDKKVHYIEKFAV